MSAQKIFMANVFPQQFGPYTLHQLVGRGGMAEIYRATMPGIGSFEKVLAIKKVLPHLAENDEYITMLTDEARLVVGLNHANIAQVYDLGQIDGSYYIAMEYVHGVDIALIIKDAKRQERFTPYEHTAYMISGLCMGLHVAHHALGRDGEPLRIIHRDVSPHNVLVSFAGDVKVIDFGVAKANIKKGETQIGVIKGKLLYMAPEQARAEEQIDGRADLFAAGLVMYKLLTWQLPFQGSNELEIYSNILTKEIVAPRTLNPDVPEELNAICMKLLERDVSKRYQDGYAAKRDLDRALHHIAPGYTPSRLSRFIEDKFLERVQQQRSSQQSERAQRERIKQPVGAPHYAAVAGAAPDTADTIALPALSSAGPPALPQPHGAPPQQGLGAGFGPTPSQPMTPSGFQPPSTPAPGFTPLPQPAPTAMTEADTGQFALQTLTAPSAASTPPRAPRSKRGIPAVLIAVVCLGTLFLAMGTYLFVNSTHQELQGSSSPRAATRSSAESDAPSKAALEDDDAPVEAPEAHLPAVEASALYEDVIDAPSPKETPPAPTIYQVRSEPSGAVCRRDGERLGQTPFNLEVDEGDYPLELLFTLEGHEDQALKLTEAQPDLEIEATLEAIKREEARRPPPVANDSEKKRGERVATKPDPAPGRRDEGGKRRVPKKSDDSSGGVSIDLIPAEDTKQEEKIEEVLSDWD